MHVHQCSQDRFRQMNQSGEHKVLMFSGILIFKHIDDSRVTFLSQSLPLLSVLPAGGPAPAGAAAAGSPAASAPPPVVCECTPDQSATGSTRHAANQSSPGRRQATSDIRAGRRRRVERRREKRRNSRDDDGHRAEKGRKEGIIVAEKRRQKCCRIVQKLEIIEE